jgi:hypothetical protein
MSPKAKERKESKALKVKKSSRGKKMQMKKAI